MKTFIAKPVVTEKSLAHSAEGRFQFFVPNWATKRQIAESISRTFGVTVIRVTTTKLPEESVTFRRKPGVRTAPKKATVRLKSGETITAFRMPVETQPATEPTTDSNESTPDAKTESNVTVRSRSKRKEA